MKRIWAAVAAMLLVAGADVRAPIPVYEGGRTVHDADGALRSGWPGVYFEGRFTGRAVDVGVETKREQVRVLIDGVEKARLGEGFSGRKRIGGLRPGAHVVRLERLTESQPGDFRFLGFWPVDGKALPMTARVRQIEIIGDSHSVGYADTSTVRDCDAAKVHATTDTQQAYGPLLAKRLDADYRVIAWSGYGIVRNYDGKAPGESLPFLYSRIIPGETAQLRVRDAWHPQLIVIYLGTNDFSTQVKPGEAWADEVALRKAWHQRYVAFVREIAANQPQARFVLVGGPSFATDVQSVAAELATSKINVTTMRTPEMALDSCHWHPSLKDQRALADALEKTVSGMRIQW